jgi:hypothetical protein
MRTDYVAVALGTHPRAVGFGASAVGTVRRLAPIPKRAPSPMPPPELTTGEAIVSSRPAARVPSSPLAPWRGGPKPRRGPCAVIRAFGYLRGSEYDYTSFGQRRPPGGPNMVSG